LELAGNAGAMEVLEEARGLVRELVDVGREVVGGAETAYRGVPPVSPEEEGSAAYRLT
jgi:hypothetical protein